MDGQTAALLVLVSGNTHMLRILCTNNIQQPILPIVNVFLSENENIYFDKKRTRKKKLPVSNRSGLSITSILFMAKGVFLGNS